MLGIALVAALPGCAATDTTPIESLDPLTSATITRATQPVLFYRDVPSQAAYGRNFVQLGPVAVNQQGQIRYFLWLGAWDNLLQDLGETPRIAELETITIMADGVPFELRLAGLLPGNIGASQPPYLKEVASAIDAYFQVTEDQIRLLAEANEVRLFTASGNSREYQLWTAPAQAKNSLQGFLRQVNY